MLSRLIVWVLTRIAARALARGLHQSIRPNGQPYIERYYLGRLGFLHEYLGEDGDRYLHNHPWRWSMGIPLVGGYTEERLLHLCPFQGPRIRIRNIFTFRPNLIMSTDFHRIAVVKPGTWTLFIHGKRLGGWGFIRSEPGVLEHYSNASGQRTKDYAINVKPYGMPDITFKQDDPQVLAYTYKRLSRDSN